MEQIDLYVKIMNTIENVGRKYHTGDYVVNADRLADELVKLFAIPDVSDNEVAVCNCPGTKITNPAIIYVCSKCDKPIDFEWQLETDC